MKRFCIILLVAAALIIVPVVCAQVATGGKVVNTTLTLAATEYRVDLGIGIKSFSVKCRGAYDLRIAFASGATATRYVTIPSGQTFYSPPCNASIILYLRCAQAGQIAEVDYWR